MLYMIVIYLLLGDLGVYQARKGIEAIPERVFNYGIREQSMISFATGIYSQKVIHLSTP